MHYAKLFLTCFFLIPLVAHAAAPDDVNGSQRAWYDAVDINGNNNYTDNPADNSDISVWTDKSGNGNNVSSTGTAMPTYRQDSLSAQRHGVDFDGVNHHLTDSDDIWSGATVDQAEILLVASADEEIKAFVYSSIGTSQKVRISSHVPWNNGITYFDQGVNCCAGAGVERLQVTVPITLSQQYFWHFTGLPSMQRIVQDGTLRASDSGAGVFNTNSSEFSLARRARSTGGYHDGQIFEAVFYQTTLNDAQRRILNSYLSAKWDKAFEANPIYADVYSGDIASNGNYDYFVGGIGQDSGTQVLGTSQGLTITNNSFLTANGKFILAGVDYLVSTPTTGTSNADLPTNYSYRSNRSWYIDTTGTGGTANLAFNASTIGLPVNNGDSYGLLHRSGTTGVFSEVATATMSGGVITFDHLPVDGVYTIGKKGSVILSLQKTSFTAQDPINNTSNPKSIPGAYIDYTLTVTNTGDSSPDTDTTVISDQITDDLVLYTGDLDGSGSPFVFTDSNCPPTSTSTSSNLTLDYPADVTFKNGAGMTVTPSSSFDSAVRSFEINLSGMMNNSSSGSTPCFTVRFRAQIQ